MELIRVVLMGIKVKDKYQEFAIDFQKLPLSINKIKALVESFTGKNINLISVDWKGDNTLKGKLHRFDDHADIYCAKRSDITPKITLCDERFIVMKEMAHLLLDTKNSYTTDIDELIQGLVYFKSSIEENSEQVQSEKLAQFLAADLLFPWEVRDSCISDIEKGVISTLDIAEKYKLPRKMVDLVLLHNNHEALRETINTLP